MLTDSSCDKNIKFCKHFSITPKVFKKYADIDIKWTIKKKGYQIMGINITHTMSNSNFENKNELRETAKRILEKKGTSSEATQKILEKSALFF